MKHSLTGVASEKVFSKDAAYNDYLRSVSLNIIKAFIVIIAAFNTVLLIPDYLNLAGQDLRLPVLLLRGAYTLMAVVLLLRVGRFPTFKRLALVITLYELAAVFIFIFVFFVYPAPDFLIQSLGVMTVILAVFLVPNLWRNMLCVAVVTAAAFLCCAYIKLGSAASMRLAASAVYLCIEIVLCALFANFLSRYKRSEYTAKAALQQIYATDPLTKIGNRIKLKEQADKWMAFCRGHNLPLSLVLVDMDNMKRINDQYGHLAGDGILCEMAQTMSAQLRKNDVCVRWGGDEFVLLLPDTDTDEANDLTQRIRKAISEHCFGCGVAITCSFGITAMKQGLGLDQMIQQADFSMYLAKRQGKDKIEINEKLGITV